MQCRAGKASANTDHLVRLVVSRHVREGLLESCWLEENLRRAEAVREQIGQEDRRQNSTSMMYKHNGIHLLILSKGLLVHLVNLFLEGLLGHVSLQLQRVGEDAIVAEAGWVQPDLLGQLEANQTIMLSLLCDLVKNHLGNGSILTQFFE